MNETLQEKLDALLDTEDALIEFARNQPTPPIIVSPGAAQFEITSEWQRLVEARDAAAEQYETAIRMNERERIKALIDGREAGA